VVVSCPDDVCFDNDIGVWVADMLVTSTGIVVFSGTGVWVAEEVVTSTGTSPVDVDDVVNSTGTSPVDDVVTSTGTSPVDDVVNSTGPSPVDDVVNSKGTSTVDDVNTSTGTSPVDVRVDISFVVFDMLGVDASVVGVRVSKVDIGPCDVAAEDEYMVVMTPIDGVVNFAVDILLVVMVLLVWTTVENVCDGDIVDKDTGDCVAVRDGVVPCFIDVDDDVIPGEVLPRCVVCLGRVDISFEVAGNDVCPGLVDIPFDVAGIVVCLVDILCEVAAKDVCLVDISYDVAGIVVCLVDILSDVNGNVVCLVDILSEVDGNDVCLVDIS